MTKFIGTFAIITVLFVGFVMVSNNSTPKSTPDTQTSNNTGKYVSLNTVNELNQRIQVKNPNDVILDVRTPPEFSEGYIEGAINIDMQSPDFDTEIQKLDKDKTYIVYCRTGNRAKTASEQMSDIDLNVVYSKSGISQWQSAGLELMK